MPNYYTISELDKDEKRHSRRVLEHCCTILGMYTTPCSHHSTPLQNNNPNLHNAQLGISLSSLIIQQHIPMPLLDTNQVTYSDSDMHCDSHEPSLSTLWSRRKIITQVHQTRLCSTIQVKHQFTRRFFGASYESDVLQNNRQKNDHVISIILLALYAVNLCRKILDKKTSQPGQKVNRSVGWENKKVFPSRLPLTVLVDSSKQVDTGILVHQILVDS